MGRNDGSRRRRGGQGRGPGGGRGEGRAEGRGDIRERNRDRGPHRPAPEARPEVREEDLSPERAEVPAEALETPTRGKALSTRDLYGLDAADLAPIRGGTVESLSLRYDIFDEW